ncbi:hypothetical protein M5C97_24645 [Acidovorax sp. NCPPB 3859]|nr:MULTISPECIES: hypothetical protein [unclassified Acidovorax]MDA8450357.1 hypothetical protein [Acidovorax sp. GBBC 3297]MDA8459802.1 hypothetical protein [Acidovorax sp. GBBC 3333]MDA8464838.1 hypothetical protein [Acidovorax sp. GBBC 3332]MDA8469703.1 hypothetical protein [Acidovorax sp. GBBC 3299]WCM78631.1 hypothetical protein M5C94_24595 [Acidovorax sp. GBBC 712]
MKNDGVRRLNDAAATPSRFRMVLARDVGLGQPRVSRISKLLLAGMALWLCGCGTLPNSDAVAADVSTSKQIRSLKERQRIAGEMFRERCKKAGVFIHRTVEGVDGVYLMKLRPKEGLHKPPRDVLGIDVKP